MSLETNPSAKLVVRLVVYSLLGWFFLTFNPFGIGDKSDQATQDALYKIAAPYYLSDAQQDIVVVLINQSSINELYERQAIQANEWPIRYRDHAYLLSRILKYSPSSVFVDIYFKKERSTDDSFSQFTRLTSRMSEKYGSSLLFAGGYQDEQHTDVQRKLDELGELVISGWQDYGQAYPLNDNGNVTAAYRMYQLACLSDSALSSCQTPLIDTTAVEAGDALSVRWGSRPGKVVFPEFSRSVCVDRSGSMFEVGRQLLFGFIEDLVSYDDMADPVNAQCAYHPVIYADELVYVDKSGTEEQKRRLAAALKDKVVMYGLSLEGLHDNVYSPAHGQLPGVFFHAMALDNMMHFGADFVHAADEQIAFINQYVWILMTIIFSTVLFYYESKDYSFSNKTDQWVRYECHGAHISAFRLFWVAALTIFVISILMFLFMRYEPLNSIGFLVLIGVSSGLVHSNFAELILKILTFSWLGRLVSKLISWFLCMKDFLSKLTYKKVVEQVLKVLTFPWLFDANCETVKQGTVKQGIVEQEKVEQKQGIEEQAKDEGAKEEEGKEEEGKEEEVEVSEKAEAFYKKVFDLELVTDHGWIRAYGTDSEVKAHVSIDPESGACASVPDLSIEVDDFEAALRRVADAKIVIEYGPETECCGIRRFYIRDPFDKLVNVFQSKKKATP